ncbi:MAG TPA: hypothetical protein VGB17_10550 [Pyrinomonadaceae bacterium]|jgi:hypothetical protein
MQEDAKSRILHQNLDTSYVNLSALLRYLRQREFTGRVHVELDEYDADVFLQGAQEPRVRETDHATGRKGEGEEALRRLLVRATQPGGLVSVYEGASELPASDAGLSAPAGPLSAEGLDQSGGKLTDEEVEWRELLRLSGELIATIERAAQSVGGDFNAAFRAARLEMADDYSFLDPATNRLTYAQGKVHLQAQPGLSAYVQSLAECLRRSVEKLAKGAHEGRMRERVALELAVLARRRQTQLARFKLASQLDRIAGTRVL